ncbi:30S ribosomal protein S7 [Patescibacteria group bacterium]|nr:MAG: 30S ribosomal protein S7 [Patescibacteria group bacterium]
MRGSKKQEKRPIAADPKYGSVQLAKFINYVMERGKKTVARAIVYGALENIAESASAKGVDASSGAKGGQGGKKDALKVFEEAVRNVAPQVEVRSRRVGGANYQVPMPVSSSRQHALTFRWIIDAARNKKGLPMAKKLAQVLLDASNNTGDAMKKRDDVHRMAEANKAFAHFARFAK